jgi:hypothetical protein
MTKKVAKKFVGTLVQASVTHRKSVNIEKTLAKYHYRGETYAHTQM